MVLCENVSLVLPFDENVRKCGWACVVCSLVSYFVNTVLEFLGMKDRWRDEKFESWVGVR